jgi:polyisoprenoid-binding protein YceI
MTSITEAIEQSQVVPAGTWKSDPVHSHVGFAVKHMVVATFRGAFGEYEVTLSDESGEPRLDGAVKAASVEVKDENLSQHLLSPDFFDVERHPEIRFSSSAIRTEGDEIVVDGDLTIKGTTKAVEARGTITEPVENIAGKVGIGLDLATTVDRTDFDLNWNAELPKGGVAVSNDVTLEVHLELAKEE